jgi:hypothetical protein
MNSNGEKSPATEIKKKQRAKWLDQMLTKKGHDKYGRATRISKHLKCGMSTVQGWMRGSLPRDMELAYRFCQEYGIDMVEWVSLEPGEWRGETPSVEDMQIVIDAIGKTIEFDISLVSEDTPRPLSASSFVKVFQVILKNLRDPSSGATASLSLFRDFVMEANEETAHKKLHEMTTQKKQNGN